MASLRRLSPCSKPSLDIRLKCQARRSPYTLAPCATPDCQTVDLGQGRSVSANIPDLLLLHKRCQATCQPFDWNENSPCERTLDSSLDAWGLRRTTAVTKDPISGVCTPLPRSFELQTLGGADFGRPCSNFVGRALAGTVSASSGARCFDAAPAQSCTYASRLPTISISASNNSSKASSQPEPQSPQTSTASPPQLQLQLPDAAAAAATTTATAAVASAEPDEHCTKPHPGSICCTTATVEKGYTANSYTVTLKASVRLTDDSRLHAAAPELEELAWLAVRDTAADAVVALNRRSSCGPMGREERHEFVCHMLEHGAICDALRMENSFGHVSYLLTLEDKDSGSRMRAVFKPRVEGDCEGWHRVPVEAAAYRLGLLLGLDLVPPAVLRPRCDVDWTHYPAGGAFIYWCGGARQLRDVPAAEWSVPQQVLLSDTRILDMLIQNSDRHAGHFLYAEHWADGSYLPNSSQAAPKPQLPQQPQPQKTHQKQQQQQQPEQQAQGAGASSCSSSSSCTAGVWRGRLSPVLIDHAAGFRPGAFVSLEHENAFLTGPTQHISAHTYLRLRFLDAPSLRAALGDSGVSEAEVGALLARRDAILAFFDALVAERGYGAVVLEG